MNLPRDELARAIDELINGLLAREDATEADKKILIDYLNYFEINVRLFGWYWDPRCTRVCRSVIFTRICFYIGCFKRRR